jgi:hypothetical protein
LWHHDFELSIVVACTLLSITARKKHEGEAGECDNDANDDSQVQYSTVVVSSIAAVMVIVFLIALTVKCGSLCCGILYTNIIMVQ